MFCSPHLVTLSATLLLHRRDHHRRFDCNWLWKKPLRNFSLLLPMMSPIFWVHIMIFLSLTLTLMSTVMRPHPVFPLPPTPTKQNLQFTRGKTACANNVFAMQYPRIFCNLSTIICASLPCQQSRRIFTCSPPPPHSYIENSGSFRYIWSTVEVTALYNENFLLFSSPGLSRPWWRTARWRTTQGWSTEGRRSSRRRTQV